MLGYALRWGLTSSRPRRSWVGPFPRARLSSVIYRFSLVPKATWERKEELPLHQHALRECVGSRHAAGVPNQVLMALRAVPRIFWCRDTVINFGPGWFTNPNKKRRPAAARPRRNRSHTFSENLRGEKRRKVPRQPRRGARRSPRATLWLRSPIQSRAL